MNNIPVYNLENDSRIGLTVRHVYSHDEWADIASFPVHRNEEYLFILNESGDGSMSVDFENVEVHGKQLAFVAPGQIHHTIRANDTNCWLVSVYPYLIDEDYLNVFENVLTRGKPIYVDGKDFTQMKDTLSILSVAIAEDEKQWKYKRLVYTILNAFLCEAASCYISLSEPGKCPDTRPRQIAFSFLKRLEKSFLTHKSPSFYSESLSITTAYLNDCVKEVIGKNVSCVIHDRIVLEAKRLLVYTNHTSKQIAHELGYEDHAYFARLFRKVVGVSPLTFRNDYLE